MVLCYYVIIIVSIELLEYFQQGTWINGDSVIKWDASHYQYIAQHGYISFRQAFFPLLPFIWRSLSLDPIGISILNATIYSASLIFLSWRYKANIETLLIWIVLPSSIFYFVPYTESLFFAGATIILYALRSGSRPLVLLGLFFCTLCRPSFTTLLPSLVLVAFLFEKNRRSAIIDSLAYIFISSVGLFLVSLTQHHSTGEWGGFFTAQKAWGNQLQLPQFPLSSWGGQAVSRLDAVAFLFGLITMTYICKELWNKMRSGRWNMTPEVLLSCGCISSITLLTLFFRGGELFSLNRFVFATPFALILLDHAIKMRRALNWKHYARSFMGLTIFFMAFGAYVHIQTLFKFTVLALYLILTLKVLLDQHRPKNWLLGMWFIITVSIQVYFAHSFLNAGWVG